MSAIDQAVAHFEQFTGGSRRHIDVPEWGAAAAPLRIFWTPLTIAQRKKCFAAANADAEIVWTKAEDEAGNELFPAVEDLLKLTHKVDGAVVARIAAEMVKAPTLEQAIKN